VVHPAVTARWSRYVWDRHPVAPDPGFTERNSRGGTPAARPITVSRPSTRVVGSKRERRRGALGGRPGSGREQGLRLLLQPGERGVSAVQPDDRLRRDARSWRIGGARRRARRDSLSFPEGITSVAPRLVVSVNCCGVGWVDGSGRSAGVVVGRGEDDGCVGGGVEVGRSGLHVWNSGAWLRAGRSSRERYEAPHRRDVIFCHLRLE
jgi:hypothetical protein